MQKKIGIYYLLSILLQVITILPCFSQSAAKPLEKSLLWEISGNGLTKPSYIFGTIHMICKDDAVIGDKLKEAIEKSDRVYFEVDMDNLFEMFSAFKDFKMRNDTTLADLLSKDEYEKVKEFMEEKSGLLPFSQLETFKPLLASSLMLESGMGCDKAVAMEQLIMELAKKSNKRIEGLETMSYQASIFDSIPYKLQAQELLKYVENDGDQSLADAEFEKMVEAYKNQDIEKLGKFIGEEDEMMNKFQDILLFNRNANWVKKLKTLMPEKAMTIAVGAGHLAGEKGLINLLRKEGYTVKPVKYKTVMQRVI